MKVPVNSLILDFDLYPRANIDSHNVTLLVEALTAGVELPPITIDKKSRKVIDGFHRCKAHLRHFGDLAEIEVVERSFKNDGAMFEEAMRLNASHGAKLDRYDRVHCVLKARELKLPFAQVATALSMHVDRLKALVDDREAKVNGRATPLKQTLRHMAGSKLTQGQEDANKKLTGMNQSTYANQLILLIDNGLIDTENSKLMTRLHELFEKLEKFLAAHV